MVIKETETFVQDRICLIAWGRAGRGLSSTPTVASTIDGELDGESERTSGLEISRNAGASERVATNGRIEPCLQGTTTDHSKHIHSVHAFVRQFIRTSPSESAE